MEKMFKQIRENWLIFSLIGGLIIWYAGVNARLTQAETDIRDLKVITGDISELKIDVAVIKNSVEYIRRNLDK